MQGAFSETDFFIWKAVNDDSQRMILDCRQRSRL